MSFSFAPERQLMDPDNSRPIDNCCTLHCGNKNSNNGGLGIFYCIGCACNCEDIICECEKCLCCCGCCEGERGEFSLACLPCAWEKCSFCFLVNWNCPRTSA